MSVIITIAVPADDVTLGDALEARPDLRVRLERIVPLDSTLIPYFWIQNDTIEDIEHVLRTEGDIETFSVVDSVDGEALVRVEWTEHVDGLLTVLAESRTTLLDGVAEDSAWKFDLRFTDHTDVTAFYRECTERGIALDVRSIHNPEHPAKVGLELGVTGTQRETLQAALDEGYFEVPRRINLTELAEQLEVSDTAVSQRLRRGITALLVATIAKEQNESMGEES